MNRKQKIALWVGGLVVVGLLIVPPAQSNAGLMREFRPFWFPGVEPLVLRLKDGAWVDSPWMSAVVLGGREAWNGDISIWDVTMRIEEGQDTYFMATEYHLDVPVLVLLLGAVTVLTSIAVVTLGTKRAPSAGADPTQGHISPE